MTGSREMSLTPFFLPVRIFFPERQALCDWLGDKIKEDLNRHIEVHHSPESLPKLPLKYLTSLNEQSCLISGWDYAQ